MGPGKINPWAVLGRQHWQDNQGCLGLEGKPPQSYAQILALVKQKTAVEEEVVFIHSFSLGFSRAVSSSTRLVVVLQMVLSNNLPTVHGCGQSRVTSLPYSICLVPSLLLHDLLLILLSEPWHHRYQQPQATLIHFSMLLSFALCSVNRK